MMKRMLALAVILSTTALADPLEQKPDFLFCANHAHESERKIGFEYDLSKRVDSKGNIRFEDTFMLDDLQMTISALRDVDPQWNGSISFSVGEKDGVWMGNEACAGGCPPRGTPKYKLLFSANTKWQSGELNWVHAVLARSNGKDLNFTCALFVSGPSYQRYKGNYEKIVSRDP